MDDGHSAPRFAAYEHDGEGIALGRFFQHFERDRLAAAVRGDENVAGGAAAEPTTASVSGKFEVICHLLFIVAANVPRDFRKAFPADRMVESLSPPS